MKMWYVHTREYYSAIKNNEIMPFVATWMLDCPTEWSKSDREGKIYDIDYMWDLKKKKTTNEFICKTRVESRM